MNPKKGFKALMFFKFCSLSAQFLVRLSPPILFTPNKTPFKLGLVFETIQRIRHWQMHQFSHLLLPQQLKQACKIFGHIRFRRKSGYGQPSSSILGAIRLRVGLIHESSWLMQQTPQAFAFATETLGSLLSPFALWQAWCFRCSFGAHSLTIVFHIKLSPSFFCNTDCWPFNESFTPSSKPMSATASRRRIYSRSLIVAGSWGSMVNRWNTVWEKNSWKALIGHSL